MEEGDSDVEVLPEIKYDVFLGYSIDDFRIAKEFTMLEEGDKPYRLCIEERDLITTTGESLEYIIENSINQSRLAVFLLSDNFINSDLCNFGLTHAYTRLTENKLSKRCLILVKISDELPSDMPAICKHSLNLFGCLDYNTPQFWQDLRHAIDKGMRELGHVK